jgi:hypothetical protein
MAVSRSVLRFISSRLPEWAQHRVLRCFSSGLEAQLSDHVTDEFLATLLRFMDLAFLLCPGYRCNILGFQGTCVFRTANEKVAHTAVFNGGHMEVKDGAQPVYDVRVTFKDSRALCSFVMSEEPDIMDAILANAVYVEGNLNYLYRFGFLANDLKRRLEPVPSAASHLIHLIIDPHKS